MLSSPRIGGHPGHSEDAERGRDGRERRIDLAQALAVAERVVLPAGVAEDDIARREAGVRRLDHPADRAADHGLADLHAWRVGLARVHAPAHVGVEGEVDGPAQNFALTRHGHRVFDQVEVALLGRALGTRGQHDLTVSLFRHCPLLKRMMLAARTPAPSPRPPYSPCCPAGRISWKQVPSPVERSSRMSPPWARISSRAIARPRPEPPGREEPVKALKS